MKIIIEDTTGNQVVYVVKSSRLEENCSEVVKPPVRFLHKNSPVLLQDKQLQLAQFYRRHNQTFLLLDSYLLVKFLYELENSTIYRNAWLSTVQHFPKTTEDVVYIYEIEPEKPYIDYAWGRRLEYLAMERLELENTMSWLSTLGGAFSALGEEFTRCAKIAGRISAEQFRLACHLGDPDTQSRCRLYLSLSLLQQGRLRPAKRIIRHEYALATAVHPDLRDTRLVRMCHGIWAKLQYLHSLGRAHRAANTTLDRARGY